MALFRRNKDISESSMPPELTQYYESEKRERTWVAWLLALATLVITAALILGIFWVGRWGYHKIKKPSNVAKVSQQPGNPSTDKSNSNTYPSTGSSSSSNSSASNNNSTNNSSSSSANSAGSSTSNSSASTNSSSAVASSTLPNTGPGNMIAIFALVSIAGTLFHAKFLTSRR